MKGLCIYILALSHINMVTSVMQLSTSRESQSTARESLGFTDDQCGLNSTSRADFVESPNADIQIIAYLDLHDRQKKSGTEKECGGIRPTAVQEMEALRWIVGILNKRKYAGKSSLGRYWCSAFVSIFKIDYL